MADAEFVGKEARFEPSKILSYLEMCSKESASLQRGMNFRLHPSYSVLLMSRRPDAQYVDRVEEDGGVIVYEGHDAPREKGGPDPKLIDQPEVTRSGRHTQNGLSVGAAHATRDGLREAEPVKVYEKLHQGVWVFNGVFRLTDAWQEQRGGRQVFKFRLELADVVRLTPRPPQRTRVIPSLVKQEVWKRDDGQCVECGATENLHFDHIIPYSRGGSSLSARNVQLLCAKHNLEKHSHIQ